MMICDLENEKTQLITENEILQTTSKCNSRESTLMILSIYCILCESSEDKIRKVFSLMLPKALSSADSTVTVTLLVP